MKRLILTALFSIPVFSITYSQSAEIRGKHFNHKKDVAIEGFDPVSYFQQGPKPGNEKINYTYKGVTYRFGTEDNKALFVKDPDKYEPQYGGWCAYAMGANGDKVKIDPKTYEIYEGKLYLFYNFKDYNTLIDWEDDRTKLLPKADLNWKEVVN